MGQRLELQSILEAILGSKAVYFQPPENIEMSYPCIVYKRDDIDTEYAGNRPYKHMTRYLVTIITDSPELSEFAKKVGDLPRSSYDRFFVANGLNHDVYNLYF